jgi:DNA-binding beta-propeller fold protein YncE
MSTTIPGYPDLRVEIEFTTGVWTRLPYVPVFSGGRGRAYELSTPQAGTMSITVDCSDGALDPDSTTSPYYPNVKINKRCRVVVDNSVNGVGPAYSGLGGRVNTTPGGGAGYAGEMIASLDGTRLFIAASQYVYVYDLVSFVQVGTVGPLQSAINGLALSPDGLTLYASVGTYGGVEVISTTDYSHTNIALSGQQNPVDLAVTPDGLTLYVACSHGEDVAIIDLTTRVVTYTGTGGGYSTNRVAITPNGLYAYACSNNGLQVISTATKAIVTTIATVTGSANRILASPDGATIYVIGTGVGVVAVSTATNTIAWTSNVEAGDGVLSADGKILYTVGTNNIHALDTTTQVATNIASTAIGGPQGIALTRDGLRIFRSAYDANFFDYLSVTLPVKTVYTGFVERYPQRWTDSGSYQWTDMVVSDAIAANGKTLLDPIAYHVINSYKPAMWWVLDDAKIPPPGIVSTSALVAASRIGGLPLSTLSSQAPGSTYGIPAQFNMGASRPTSFPNGMENATAAGFTPGPNALTVSPADMTVLRSPPNTPPLPPSGGWTVYVSAASNAPNLAGAAPNGSRVMVLNSDDGSQFIAIGVDGSDNCSIFIGDANGVTTGSPGVTANTYYRIGTNPTYIPAAGKWNSGAQHSYAVSLSADKKTLYTAVSDNRFSEIAGYYAEFTKNDYSTWEFPGITSFSVGGEFRPNRNGNFAFNAWTGTVNNIAIWNSEMIHNGVIGDIMNAEVKGYSGEDTVARFNRLMKYARPGIRAAATTGVGTSKVQAPIIKGKTLATALSDNTVDELGTLFVNGAGDLAFASRASRYNPNPLITLTDQGADGPGVYRYTDLKTDYDDTKLLNTVEVKRNNGVTARSVDQASVDQHGAYSSSVTTNIVSDQQAIDRAAYTVGRYAQPITRIASLTLSPGSDPTLWPLVTSLELNQAVTVVRTPAKGHSSSHVCWVEKIDYSADADAGKFTVTLQLSPADVSNYLVLDDPVRGKLDSGNRFAY